MEYPGVAVSLTGLAHYVIIGTEDNPHPPITMCGQVLRPDWSLESGDTSEYKLCKRCQSQKKKQTDS
jgi:hypothetical protein